MPCADGFTWYGEPSLIPRAASAFAFITFPEEIDVKARGMLCTYFTHLKGTMYPIARYAFSDAADAYWFHWTQVDLAYLHSVLFTTSFFYDTLTVQKSESTKYHSYRAIRELNKQLADSKTALSDTTTTVVMAMALIAACFGDLESAHIHVAGLKRIIDLRGGITAYRSRPLLQAKLYRICTGCEPAFPNEALPYSSAFDHLPRLSPLKPPDASSPSRSRAFVRTLDRRLYKIFKDVQDLSQLLNSSYETGHKIQQLALEELLTSVQSRLLKLRFHNSANSISELLRLALTAYLTTVFWSFPDLKFDYPHLAAQLRRTCLSFSPTTITEKRHFVWALTVGAISLYHGHDQAWLRQRLYPLIPEYLGSNWLQARETLSQVMWIGSIHDCPAIEVFGGFLRESYERAAPIVEASPDW
ncbi:hypothetical protein LA080_006521 [Diaporthe eres]|nr:hypothetical protein LA080_006521 [Diaporthe eres]